MDELAYTIDMFRRDLWKDQRKLEVVKGKNEASLLVKYYDDIEEMDTARLIYFDCGHYIHYFKSEDICRAIKEFVNNLND